MSTTTMVAELRTIREQRFQTYKRAFFMASSAVVASTGIILFFNNLMPEEALTSFSSRAEIAAVTLMPYMISAVIAAITAVSVTAIIPAARYAEPSVHLVRSLREVAAGDLTTHLRLKSDDPLRDIANELNVAVGGINNQVTRWKIANRIQWGALCRIRMAAEQGDCDDVLHFCEEMERNWDKIAEIEQSLRT